MVLENQSYSSNVNSNRKKQKKTTVYFHFVFSALFKLLTSIIDFSIRDAPVQMSKKNNTQLKLHEVFCLY